MQLKHLAVASERALKLAVAQAEENTQKEVARREEEVRDECGRNASARNLETAREARKAQEQAVAVALAAQAEREQEKTRLLLEEAKTAQVEAVARVRTDMERGVPIHPGLRRPQLRDSYRAPCPLAVWRGACAPTELRAEPTEPSRAAHKPPCRGCEPRRAPLPLRLSASPRTLPASPRHRLAQHRRRSSPPLVAAAHRLCNASHTLRPSLVPMS